MCAFSGASQSHVFPDSLLLPREWMAACRGCVGLAALPVMQQLVGRVAWGKFHFHLSCLAYPGKIICSTSASWSPRSFDLILNLASAMVQPCNNNKKGQAPEHM